MKSIKKIFKSLLFGTLGFNIFLAVIVTTKIFKSMGENLIVRDDILISSLGFVLIFVYSMVKPSKEKSTTYLRI